MALLKEEQEVCISFDKIDDMAKLYTSDPKWIRKMDKLCQDKPDVFKKITDNEDSASYVFPKKNVSIRKGNAKIELDPEEKERRKNSAFSLKKNK